MNSTARGLQLLFVGQWHDSTALFACLSRRVFMTNELNLLDNRAPVTGGKNGKRMRSNLSLKGLGWILAAGVIAAVASPASAQTLTTLASFAGYSTDTLGPLVADANGNLFGTRTWDGPLGYGTVFEIVKAAGGYAATPTILFSFDGTHGAYPHASLVADASGNLFGTTTDGGPSDMGTIFEIVKTAGGYAGVPTIL